MRIINIMKNLIFIAVLHILMLESHPARAQNASEYSIFVSGIKYEYAIGEPISFTVCNNSVNSMGISTIGLYRYNSKTNEWERLLWDILAYSCPSDDDLFTHKYGSLIATIDPHSDMTFIWDPEKTPKRCFDYSKETGTFKIIFHILNANKETKRIEMETNKFHITP